MSASVFSFFCPLLDDFTLFSPILPFCLLGLFFETESHSVSPFRTEVLHVVPAGLEQPLWSCLSQKAGLIFFFFEIINGSLHHSFVVGNEKELGSIVTLKR